MGEAPILSNEQRSALDRLNRLPILAELDPLGAAFGVGFAGVRDLAVMKLAAISRRGLRRDFWDLYEILRTPLTLRECGEAYVQRFGIHDADLYHVLRALTLFDDAEKDPVFPLGLHEPQWRAIKAFFRTEARKLVLPRDS